MAEEMMGVTLPEETPAERVGSRGRIDEKVVREASATLEKYRSGKANLEKRLIANEEWYKLRHWAQLRKHQKGDPEPASAWLFNSLANKHADAMDNYPECSVLPREPSDKESAATLSSILPVVIEQNDYEQIYSSVWWQKLIGGTGVTGVFWNGSKNNGLGDIDIRKVDILNLFWEAGITDLQASRNVFHVTLIDNDILEEQYPELKGKLQGGNINVNHYIYDDNVDTSDKSAVIDWYYKKNHKTTDEFGVVKTREVLHYCKYVNDTVLYASENDPAYAERGYYDHGKYPFVFDVMFPDEGTPAGFGYLDIMKDAQMYIDKLDQSILKYTFMMAHPRWFTRIDGDVNEDEFADWEKPFIHLPNGVGEDNLRQMSLHPLNSLVVNIKNSKVDELKETSGNRDFSQGSTTSGVTAASAIAALQEAGSKLSRDMLKASYRAYKSVCNLVLELIRQFYDVPRYFRITGEQGQEQFVQFDNSKIQPQQQGNDFGIQFADRIPVFDLVVRAYKSNPFSKVAQNQLALEFYSAGFFNPQMADQALTCIDMMDFEGKDELTQKISQNGTLFQQLQQMQQQMMQMAQIIDAQNGSTISQGMAQEQGGQAQPTEPATSVGENNPLGEAVQSARRLNVDQARLRAQGVSEPR